MLPYMVTKGCGLHQIRPAYTCMIECWEGSHRESRVLEQNEESVEKRTLKETHAKCLIKPEGQGSEGHEVCGGGNGHGRGDTGGGEHREWGTREG